MKEWLTLTELRDLGLSGLPRSLGGLQKLALRDAWEANPDLCRKREGRGGGLEYHVAALPLMARLDFHRRNLKVDAPPAPPAPALTDTLPAGRPLAERDARLALLRAADAFRRASSGGRLSIIASDQMFARLYTAGKAEVPAWVTAAVPKLSARSLARWRSAARFGETTKLAVDRGENRRGKGLLEIANDGAVRTHMLALLVAQPMLSADHIRRLVRAEFGDEIANQHGELVPLPPIRTFQHVLKGLKASHRVELTALTNPDQFRSHFAVAGTNSLRHVVRANQLWQIDASPADALCTHGRYSVYVAVDIATRRLMVLVSRTPRASAVGLLIRRAILAWGVPEAIKTDNGSDFVAVQTQRLFTALEIDAVTSNAFSPQEKGHVERAIRTLQHDLVTTLPGFVGHSVADRKGIEARKSFAERLGESEHDTFGVALDGHGLQERCDGWVDNIYSHRAHAGLKGRTPFEAASMSRELVRTVDERVLDVLLAPCAGGDGYRVATKQGIRVDHFHYLAPFLMPGDRAFVRMDPTDLGRIYLFDAPDGRFLGHGVCAELAGIDPAEAVRAAKAEQKRIIDGRMREAKAEAKRIAKGPALADLIRKDAEAHAPNLIAFPKREIAHETPAIAAALEAAAPAPAPQHSEEALAMHARLQAEANVVQPIRDTDTPHMRWRLALDLEAALERGEDLSESSRLWLGGYQKGHEYRGFGMTYRDSPEPPVSATPKKNPAEAGQVNV